MKVLFIGNSYIYYNDLPLLFEKLANANGREVQTFSVTCGGRRLIENLEKQDEYSEKIDALLKVHMFDLVILQEHSMGSLLNYDGFCRGISGLRDKLRNHAKQFMLYETWGRKSGSPDLEKHGWTQESMTHLIAEAYERAGEDMNIPVSYVGLKFWAVSSKHPEIELFDPDRTHPSYAGSCLAAMTLYASAFGTAPKNYSAFELPESILQVFSESLGRED